MYLRARVCNEAIFYNFDANVTYFFIKCQFCFQKYFLVYLKYSNAKRDTVPKSAKATENAYVSCRRLRGSLIFTFTT